MMRRRVIWFAQSSVLASTCHSRMDDPFGSPTRQRDGIGRPQMRDPRGGGSCADGSCLPAHPVWWTSWGARLVHQEFPRRYSTAMVIPALDLCEGDTDLAREASKRSLLGTLGHRCETLKHTAGEGRVIQAAKRNGCMVRRSATLWTSAVKLGTSATLTPLGSTRLNDSIRRPSPRPNIS